MAAYTSFAIIGVGSLGTHVVNELLKHKVSVKVLTRNATKPAFNALTKTGATVIQVDYSNETELKKALAGVEVVVSTVGLFGVDAQVGIAKVAKTAGVQLFVPAEFCVPKNVGFDHSKKVVQDALIDLQLPYTLFFTGFFAEDHVYLGFDYANGKIRAVGSGDIAFSTTSRVDIARFVAHTLTTAVPSDLAWTKVSIEGDRNSYNEIAVIAEKKLCRPFEIEYVDLEETRKDFTTDVMAFLTTMIADGDAVSGSADAVQAAIVRFYPDWSPAPLEEFVGIY